jgi:hypothetical protein
MNTAEEPWSRRRSASFPILTPNRFAPFTRWIPILSLRMVPRAPGRFQGKASYCDGVARADQGAERGMVRVRRTPRNRASPRPFGRDDGVVDAMRTIATLSKRLQRLETRMTLSGEPLVIQVQYVSPNGSVDDGPRICVPGAAERRVGMERL